MRKLEKPKQCGSCHRPAIAQTNEIVLGSGFHHIPAIPLCEKCIRRLPGAKPLQQAKREYVEYLRASAADSERFVRSIV